MRRSPLRTVTQDRASGGVCASLSLVGQPTPIRPNTPPAASSTQDRWLPVSVVSWPTASLGHHAELNPPTTRHRRRKGRSGLEHQCQPRSLRRRGTALTRRRNPDRDPRPHPGRHRAHGAHRCRDLVGSIWRSLNGLPRPSERAYRLRAHSADRGRPSYTASPAHQLGGQGDTANL